MEVTVRTTFPTNGRLRVEGKAPLTSYSLFRRNKSTFLLFSPSCFSPFGDRVRSCIGKKVGVAKNLFLDGARVDGDRLPGTAAAAGLYAVVRAEYF